MSRRAAISSLMTAGAREKAHLPIPPHQSIYYFLSAYVIAITELPGATRSDARIMTTSAY